MTTQTLTPVVKAVTVNVPRQRAFDFFTRNHADWWPIAGHSITEGATHAVLEPREGGRWYETGASGECEWGYVMAYEPPERLLLAWQLDTTWRYNADFLTEVEVRFVAEGENATRVEIEHRGMERFGAEIRSSFDGPNGWSGVLAAYARHLDDESGPQPSPRP